MNKNPRIPFEARDRLTEIFFNKNPHTVYICYPYQKFFVTELIHRKFPPEIRQNVTLIIDVGYYDHKIKHNKNSVIVHKEHELGISKLLRNARIIDMRKE